MLLRDPKNQSSANRDYLETSEVVWNRTSCSLNEKLETFTKYVSRESMTKFLARAHLFERQMNVHGSVVELGVARGSGLFSWLQLSTIYEPANYTRQIIGFDTFKGFPSVSAPDLASEAPSEALTLGGYSVAADMRAGIEEAVRMHDLTRFLGHVPKVRLIQGAIETTLPEFLDCNPHLVVSLLNIDADLFSPTQVALRLIAPRIPKGGIVIFDELGDERFPGETAAVHEVLGISALRLKRFSWCPTLSYWVKK